MSIPNFHAVWYDATRALYAGFVTRSLAADDETKMAALGGIAGSENRLISFFERTKALLAEAEQCIYVFSSVGDIDRIEMLHERLSEVGETLFILRERELPNSSVRIVI